MARFSRLLKSRKNSSSIGGSKFSSNDLNKGWTSPEYDHDSIRLVIFRDHFLRGRVPLFDSKAFPKQTGDQQCKGSEPDVKVKTPQCNTPKPSGRPGSDMKMLEEMIFGSVAMAHQGCTLKVHEIRTPPQLMVTKVFPELRPGRESSGETESFDSLSLQGESGDSYTTPKTIAGAENAGSPLAQSVPLDVPTIAKHFNHKDEDSGVSNSMSSSCTSLNTPLPSPSSNSSSLNSDSYKHRRFIRNLTTSLEMQFWKRFSDDSNGSGEVFPSSKKSAKLGLGILFKIQQGKSEQINKHFENFFFSHITLIEGHVDKLRAGIEKILLNRRWCSQLILQELEIFRNAICDLYKTPRLSEPVWLNMMTLSTRRVPLCQQYMKELMQVVNKYDTKGTSFFLSKLITAVLTHHLAWVPTVAPAGATPSRTYLDKHSAKWLDALAKSHPYNPLWAQLGDLYGAVGFPLRLSRTLIVGKKVDVVCKILYILSYFIRCSQVHENNESFDNIQCDEFELLDDLDDDLGAENLPFSEMTPISEDTERITSPERTLHYNHEGKISVRYGHFMAKSDLSKSESKDNNSLHNSSGIFNPSSPGFKTKDGEGISPLDPLIFDHSSSASDVSFNNTNSMMETESWPSRDDDNSVIQSSANTLTESSHTAVSTAASPPSPVKCQLSPVEIREARVLQVRHVGRMSNHESENPMESLTTSPMWNSNSKQNEQRDFSSREDLRNDSGVFDGASVDMDQKGVHVLGNSTFYVDLNDTAEKADEGISEIKKDSVHRTSSPVMKSGSAYIHQMDSHQCVTRASDCDSCRDCRRRHHSGNSMKGSLNSLPQKEIDNCDNICQNKNSSLLAGQSATSSLKHTQTTTCEKTSHSKCLVNRALSCESSSSMFDEYFTDDNHIDRLCPDITQPALYFRMPSLDSSCVFDETFKAKDLTPADNKYETSGSLSKGEDVRNTSETLETVCDGSGYGSEMRQRCDSQGSKRLHRAGGKLNSAERQPFAQYSRQNSNASGGTPARTRCVTPTELGRRRHQSSASNVSDVDVFDPFLNLKEVPMLRSDFEEDSYTVQTFERNFGYSLMAGYSDHYLSDFALQGTSDPHYIDKLHRDLSSSVQNSILDEPITESVCIVADIDKWCVQLVSAQYTSPERFVNKEVAPSPMISDMIESLQDLWKLKMSPEFCLMHLEDRLQEIYFRSKTVAEYLRSNKLNSQQLAQTLGIDENDVPLLLAVAGTHTTNLVLGLI